MLTTTFDRLHKAGACEDGYRKLAKHLGGIRKYGRNTPITLLTVLDSIGLDDALRGLRATVEPAEGFARDTACDFAERARNHGGTPDPRSIAAVETARRHARGLATDDELTAARAAAWDSRVAAGDAFWAASWAAWDAGVAERQWQSERLRARLLAHDAETNPLGLITEPATTTA